MGYSENRESRTVGVAQRCAHWSQVPFNVVLDDCLLFCLSVGAQPAVTMLGMRSAAAGREQVSGAARAS
jgi:hypothetical protein